MPIFVAVYIGLSENRVPSILTDYKFFSLFSFLGHTSFLYVNVFPSPTNYNIETLLCWCFSMFPLYQKLFIHQSPHIYVLYIHIYIYMYILDYVYVSHRYPHWVGRIPTLRLREAFEQEQNRVGVSLGQAGELSPCGKIMGNPPGKYRTLSSEGK